ncbi:MAG TPA: hydroxymethylbilane synthase [Hyphomonas sp.]|nr:hydroxymethylbilane synthase [Hyphomonas sp.]MCA8903361.1 hydroxymethylbilane synthase [Hyphomonas sp.]MCB9970661.1 hydroxymethylbilane synthase [Hyphomonas sp.]HPE49444.1 hydroxymethylbilane synthase [Hyphomonas sp.]
MTEPRILRIGTRGSPLALFQANHVAAAIAANSGGAMKGEIVTFTTSGDQLTTERLINSGGKGLFTRELDAALDRGEVDVTVHSLKDVPSVLPGGQVFAAFPEREDPREGFLSPHARSLMDLPKGAKVGTASLRREAQTRALRPDLEIVTFRGNVATRMRKLEEGLADATYLAMAGLTRLGMQEVASPIPLSEMLPAAAQGIIGVVIREDMDSEAAAVVRSLNHKPTWEAAMAERAFLLALDGSCRTPIAAHMFDEGEDWKLVGEVLAMDGSMRWSAEGLCRKGASAVQLEALGKEIARIVRRQAGGELPAFRDEW